jgi:EAL domain-containing protein (putative c-di-GMP-specific phosphodiesterase class I)
MLLQDMKTTVAALERVRTLGVHVAIDDYGTGFSSLSYMKELPVDTLKIDRCFITDICSEYTDQAIVHSTIVLARNLKMKVLAEGVETVEQLAMLQAYGCEEIQGYLFSRPMPEEEFLTLLREGTRYPV